jgi:hypothetical protein
MQLSLSFRNAELVRMGLANLDAEIPKIPRKPIYDTTMAIIRREKEYPARSFSTYTRTFQFRAGWGVEPYELGYRIYNRTPYGKHVVGNAFGQEQAWMHVGIWKPFADVAEEEIAKLPDAVRKELSLAVRRNRLA